jgi:hypothetical protein
MKRITGICLIIFFVLSNVSYLLLTAEGAVPHLISYQGKLTDKNGKPLKGTYDISFRIYDVETDGNLLWEETHQEVTLEKGVFSVILGSVTNLDLLFDKQYFLEIEVDGEVMSPRQKITSAGYAFRAESAEKAVALNMPAQKGDILYYDGSAWTRLAAGIDGQYLKTLGKDDNPIWATISTTPHEVFSFSLSHRTNYDRFGMTRFKTLSVSNAEANLGYKWAWYCDSIWYEELIATKFKKTADIATVTFYALVEGDVRDVRKYVQVDIGGQVGIASTTNIAPTWIKGFCRCIEIDKWNCI